MKIVKALGWTLASFGLLIAQAPEDPVLRARDQRGLSANLSDDDLPPVPRGITEPPPLPPPEMHHRDQRPTRVSQRRGGRRTKKVRKQTQPRSKRAVKRSVKRVPKRHK